MNQGVGLQTIDSGKVIGINEKQSRYVALGKLQA